MNTMKEPTPKKYMCGTCRAKQGECTCAESGRDAETIEVPSHEEWLWDETDRMLERIDYVVTNSGKLADVIYDSLKLVFSLGYKEGCKDSEGTKNGVKRYQMGFEDGKKQRLEEARNELGLWFLKEGIVKSDTQEIPNVDEFMKRLNRSSVFNEDKEI